MTVLILSAIFACATAVPSGLAPLPYGPLVVAPTIPSGDFQAAAIDAQVKYNDHARYLGEQAKQLAEQALENENIRNSDLARARAEAAQWAAEQKQWQELNERQVAEAAGSVKAHYGETSDDQCYDAYLALAPDNNNAPFKVDDEPSNGQVNSQKWTPDRNAFDNDQSDKAHWAAEEKKWQALNQAQIADAKLEGLAASNAGAFAKSSIVTSLAPAPIVPVPYSSFPFAPAQPIAAFHNAALAFKKVW